MVLRAGEAARMEKDDDSRRPKRVSKPPRWHQDYLLSQPSILVCTQGQITSEHVPLELSQGAAISETQAEVRGLAEDVQQIKGMLSELNQTMRTMHIRSRSSSFSISLLLLNIIKRMAIPELLSSLKWVNA